MNSFCVKNLTLRECLHSEKNSSNSNYEGDKLYNICFIYGINLYKSI